ncbi:methyltransferase domain-containing protein [Desulfobacula phenolica]|uniref:O-antigen chain-terminating methyltransferase n=1 Tax=Desulfobacula phenolica TaxID=90732 RepID=A0A1H2DP69_9BACT|nr:methyltransferase domain-containing protein [Desulfobacula phenolica]SDT84675.1 O-antigen chain-terminating methyltransferase [Desulfobacula phenolica]
MIEINNPEINIDEIKVRIEEELQQHKTVHPLLKGTDFKSVPRDSRDVESVPRDVSKDYFLQFHGQEFINRVYASILHREPDPQGGKIYLDKLQSGELTKVDIIGRLRYSREGRRKKVLVKGLLLPFLLRIFFKIPLLGWGLRFVTCLLNLPAVLKNIRKLESASIEQTFLMEEKMEKTLRQLKDEIENLKKDIIRAGAVRDTRITEISREQARFGEEALMIGKADKNDFLKLPKQIKDQKITLLDMQRRILLLLEEARKRLPEPISNEALTNMVKEEDHIMDAMYLSFEDRFRGEEADIKERVSVYLPYVQKACEKTNNGLVLDVGCGRGEWLKVLKENKITATGLDLNRLMVGKCREAGLDVVESEVLAYLRDQKSTTLSVVTGFHIVEHLPFKTMIALFDESLRVLKPGGMVVFETPNPENLMVGACDFYTDPSHQNPIPPNTLAYLIEARGFVNPEILRLHPENSIHIEDQFLNHYFTIGRDYSVIGFKA